MRGILVFDGDSISLGVGASYGHTLADQVIPLLPEGMISYVTAAGGRQVKECLKLFESGVCQLYDKNAASNVIFFHAGDNDIAWGSNAHETYAAIKDYITLAHHQGWRVVVSTELQRYDWPHPARYELDLLNSFILANNAGADGVADFQGDPIMGSERGRLDQTCYTMDGVHPADAGYAILAKIAAAALLPAFLSASELAQHIS